MTAGIAAGVISVGVVVATGISPAVTVTSRHASGPGTSAVAAASGRGAAAKGRQRQPGHPAVAAAAPDRPRHQASGHQTSGHQTSGHRQAPDRSRHQASGHRQALAWAPARGAGTYLFYDSVIPDAIPPHHLIATYATGGHPTPPADVAGRGPILWIDVDGSDPAASALDIEPGTVAPSVAPVWVRQKLTANPKALAVLYSSISEWPAIQAAVAPLPSWMRSRIRWWIADPTGYPHIVPGSDATQWYWGSGYDISTATSRF